jgi:hypothetical protein
MQNAVLVIANGWTKQTMYKTKLEYKYSMYIIFQFKIKFKIVNCYNNIKIFNIAAIKKKLYLRFLLSTK